MTQVASPAGSFTVSADLIRGIIDCAAQCGVSRARLSDMIGSDGRGTTTSSPPVRYSGEHILKLWDRIQRETSDPIIGFRMARFAGVKTFGALGQILPHCATVLEAYRQTARYSALASQGGHVSVMCEAATLTVCLAMPNLPPSEVSRTIMLWGLTNLCFVPKLMAAVELRPKAVTCTFPAPAPAHIRALSEHFPFAFGADNNQIVFDRSVGDIKIPSANADLQSLLAETMDRHLAALPHVRACVAGSG